MNFDNMIEVINCLKKDEKYNELGNKINNEHIFRNFVTYKEINVIFDNNSFIIEYNKSKEEFVLTTGFSNQVVDEFFINALNVLNKKVEEINKILNK